MVSQCWEWGVRGAFSSAGSFSAPNASPPADPYLSEASPVKLCSSLQVALSKIKNTCVLCLSLSFSFKNTVLMDHIRVSQAPAMSWKHVSFHLRGGRSVLHFSFSSMVGGPSLKATSLSRCQLLATSTWEWLSKICKSDIQPPLQSCPCLAGHGERWEKLVSIILEHL